MGVVSIVVLAEFKILKNAFFKCDCLVRREIVLNPNCVRLKVCYYGSPGTSELWKDAQQTRHRISTTTRLAAW